jgi:hypothetical protein
MALLSTYVPRNRLKVIARYHHTEEFRHEHLNIYRNYRGDTRDVDTSNKKYYAVYVGEDIVCTFFYSTKEAYEYVEDMYKDPKYALMRHRTWYSILKTGGLS